MKAALFEHRGKPVAIRDVPTPHPREHEVLVRVVAAGVNPVDWKMRERSERRLPFVLGQDFAGVVVATGERVQRYDVGERVFGVARDHGAYAEFTLVPEDDPRQPIAKIPDDVGDADAAALPTAGLTALASIAALGVKSGSRLLVVGATGGVGGLAVQIARDRGAQVAGVGRSDHQPFAQELGVERYVAYDRTDVASAVKSAFPDGIDAVLDLVDGPDEIWRMSEVLKRGGSLVSTIGAADERWFAERGIAAKNLVMNETPQSSHAGLRQLVELVEQGRIRVRIVAEHPLSEAERALEQSKAGTLTGKLVLTM